MRQFFHFLEVITWSITTILTIICFVFIIYQLYILYIPYWLNLRGETPYLFPEYFYRVYGEKITSLGYEHYGYLVSAVVLSGIAAGYVIPNHPFASKNCPKIGPGKKID